MHYLSAGDRISPANGGIFFQPDKVQCERYMILF
jgi:hypothetical protein